MQTFKRLPHREYPTALQIHNLSQTSYRIEANLIGVEDFPPLKRGIEYVQKSSSDYYGFVEGNVLVASTEIITTNRNEFDISSLVVSPDHFRRGLGSRLIKQTLEELNWKTVTVSTASANTPAIKLYEKLGFRESSRKRIDEKITIVEFILKK